MLFLQLGPEYQRLRLHYEIHGTGKIKIIFIMGLLADGAAWVHQADFFRDKTEYQCVTFDNRGCNLSSSPRTFHYTTLQMAKDALALIDHLQWSKCHVVGISMGGMIALELALIAPERILSLTLLATYAGGLSGRAPLEGVLHILRSITIRDEDTLIENAMKVLYARKTISNPDKKQSLFDFHKKRFQKRVRPSLIGFLGQIGAVFRHYVSYAHLLKIRYSRFPCLIMVGTEDRMVRESNSYLLQRVLGCRLIRLDDAGHGLHGEYADEINQALYHLFESIRKKEIEGSGPAVPEEYQIEIKAVEKCCQHRMDCIVYDLFGCIQGFLFGFMLYCVFTFIGWSHIPFLDLKITFSLVLWMGCLNGIRRALLCIFHTLNARQYVVRHQLELNHAADHGGVGVSCADKGQSGIPHACGFDYPYRSIFLLLLMIFSLVRS